MANIYSWSATPGSNATQGDINFSEGQAPSTLNGSSRVLMSDVAKWRDLISGAKISATADTMTLTSGASLASYAQGTLICFENGATNTTAVTINVDSLGAKAIVKNFNVPLVAGDLVSGGIYIIAYEATAGNFQLLSPGSRQQATLVGAETLTNKTLTSPVLNTGVSGSAFLDEDDLASNSATKLASQQSLKTYIDAAASSVDADGAESSATAAAASAVTAANYAVKVDGVAAGSDHSAKAWAVGGTGVTDTSSKGAAKEWATEAEDNTVAGGGTFSALHYSAKASAFSTVASGHATTASNAATTAVAAAAGIYWKEPVKAASTGNLTLSGTQTVDGISLGVGDRVLVKDQSSAPTNGVYIVAASTWARSVPLNAYAEFVGAALLVSQGTLNADTAWICTNDAGGSLGSTAIVWAAFGLGGGGGAYLGEGGDSPDGDSGDIIRINQQILNNSVTMVATDNGSCTGPLTIADSVVVTISSGATFKVL